MFKILVKFVVVLALLIVGLKFGLEYYYKQKLDEAIQAARVVAKIRYGSLNIGFDGSVNVSRIEVRPNQINQAITAKNVRLFSSDRLFLFKGLKIFANGNLPDNFDVNIDDLSHDASFGQTSASKKGCLSFTGEIDISSFVDGDLVSDVDILLDASSKSEAKISVNVDAQDVYSINSFFSFDGFAFSDGEPALVLQKMMAEGDLPIKTLRFDAKYAPNFANKLLSYCADSLGLEPQQYLSEVVNSDEYYQRLDFVPSTELKQAVQLFSEGKAELSLRATPSKSGRNFRRLAAYQPEDMAKFLNLTVLVDDQELSELFLVNEADKKNVVLSKGAGNSSINKTAALNNKQNQKRAVQKRTSTSQGVTVRKKEVYRKVRLIDAKRYIGRDVRVERRGRLLEGNLLSWGDRKVVLERYRFGGRTEMPLNVDEIVGLEVLR